MSHLILHCGAELATRHDLAAVPVPERTDTYEPLPHLTFVEMVANRFESNGLQIARERYGLTPNGNRMFGLIEFESILNEAHDPIRFAAGLRNSYDKSMAAGAAAGGSVKCCDNMLLSGDWYTCRKHTKFIRVDLEERLDQFVEHLPHLRQQQELLVSTMQTTVAPDQRVAEFLLNDTSVGASRARRIWQEYKEPREDHGLRRTTWNLYNAYTRVAQELGFVAQSEIADRAMRRICKAWSITLN